MTICAWLKKFVRLGCIVPCSLMEVTYVRANQTRSADSDHSHCHTSPKPHTGLQCDNSPSSDHNPRSMADAGRYASDNGPSKSTSHLAVPKTTAKGSHFVMSFFWGLKFVKFTYNPPNAFHRNTPNVMPANVSGYLVCMCGWVGVYVASFGGYPKLLFCHQLKLTYSAICWFKVTINAWPLRIQRSCVFVFCTMPVLQFHTWHPLVTARPQLIRSDPETDLWITLAGLYEQMQQARWWKQNMFDLEVYKTKVMLLACSNNGIIGASKTFRLQRLQIGYKSSCISALLQAVSGVGHSSSLSIRYFFIVGALHCSALQFPYHQGSS